MYNKEACQHAMGSVKPSVFYVLNTNLRLDTSNFRNETYLLFNNVMRNVTMFHFIWNDREIRAVNEMNVTRRKAR